MISLDLDINKLVQNYGININLANTNAYSSINSYSQTDSDNSVGGKNATNINVQGLSEKNIIDILHLLSPRDRLVVLNKLSQSDLDKILPLLTKDQMAVGLKFFTKDKLLGIIYNLSKEDILKIVGQIYNPQEILAYANQKDINTLLSSGKISQDDLMKQFKSLPLSKLAQIYEAATGMPIGNKNQDQIIGMFKNVDKELIIEGIESLPFKDQISMMGNLTSQNASLFECLPKSSLMRPLEESSKTNLTTGMTALTIDQLIKQLEQLPQNLLAQVTTQLDAGKLAEFLQKNNPELIAELAA